MKTRTYRIRLSELGCEAFLSCNFKLGRVSHSFVPHGHTQFVALLLADRVHPATLADVLDHSRTRSFSGPTCYYVGMADISEDVTYRMIKKLERNRTIYKTPGAGELYVAGIAIMLDATDDDVRAAYKLMHELVSAAV
ncbi:hypothetical protein PX554_23860 [Sphingomonas sp. H39-1-10]|uniref:hypothetical protein n=1 Tax=Sphingomonas pollutisoli TaxID=3030829 RepID=UPI0023B8F8F3|nr:hypothetical protein [Sphingomonas pollutisoli]MDF0491164.1 hypothetical protein [Sphingomonas pollutisoli]